MTFLFTFRLVSLSGTSSGLPDFHISGLPWLDIEVFLPTNRDYSSLPINRKEQKTFPEQLAENIIPELSRQLDNRQR
jgi:hypothetical protein